jgi:hypothetical protein
MSQRAGPRLPPPAFPPGIAPGQRAAAPEHEADLALIEPDEPLPTRYPLPDGEGQAEEGIATGIGDDAHLDPSAWAAETDPYLGDLTAAVSKLAEALKRRGEAGLHAAPSMSRFEATLRAYCVGYLAGRRAEDAEG